MLGSIDRNAHRLTDKLKIHFSIEKHVRYGRRVYVVGNCLDLGMWSIASSFRLNWNQGDQWSGVVELDRRLYQKIQFKYVIGDWDYPQNSSCQWEEGFRNRKLSLETHRNSIVCNHKWGLDKITILLLISSLVQGDQYYVIGNIPELGSWKSKRKMNFMKVKQSSLQKVLRSKRSCDLEAEIAFSYTFFVNRNRKNMRYYYIKKNMTVVAERHPGRMLDLNNLDAKKHPECHQINYSTGDVQILQTCKFNQLNFSKITEKIYVGAYLRTSQDFQQLKKRGINTVFSIQSKQDYSSHCLSPDYLKALCLENGIKYHSYSIRDMNAEEFIEKCLGAFLLLRNMLVGDNNKVYVHCSAGIYRSPQIIVVYLVLVDGYGLDEAIDMVTEKHPFARPNYTVLSEALNQISKRMSRLIIQS